MMRAATVVGGCVMVLAFSAAGWAAPAASRDVERVVVMPFENVTRDARLYWLVEGAAVLLTADLESLGRPAIPREARLQACAALQLPAQAALSYATIIRVAGLAGATDVVVGTLGLDGDRLTVTARGLRLDSGRFQPEVVETGPVTDLFATFDRVARKLLAAPPPSGGEAGRGHPPLAAFEQYVKGLIASTPQAQVTFLETALRLHAAYDAARVALWHSLTAQEEATRALAAVSAVSDNSPLTRTARFLASLSLIQLKRYDEAFVALQRLADQAPSAAVHNNLGVVQMRRGGSAETGSPAYFFSRAVEQEPGSPDHAFNLGYAYALDRDAPAAIYWLREAVRRKPGDADAHVVLGAALKAAGEAAAGERELELARRLSSAYAAGEARADGALEAVPRGLERVSDDLDLSGRSAADSGVMPQELREQRDLAAFHLERGRRLHADQKDREAASELERSLYLSPYQAEAHVLLARTWLRSGRIREAIEAAKIAIWCDEDSAAAHVALGEAYLASDEAALARGEAQAAILLDPRSEEARQLLAKIPPGGLNRPDAL